MWLSWGISRRRWSWIIHVCQVQLLLCLSVGGRRARVSNRGKYWIKYTGRWLANKEHKQALKTENDEETDFLLRTSREETARPCSDFKVTKLENQYQKRSCQQHYACQEASWCFKLRNHYKTRHLQSLPSLQAHMEHSSGQALFWTVKEKLSTDLSEQNLTGGFSNLKRTGSKTPREALTIKKVKNRTSNHTSPTNDDKTFSSKS